MPKEKAASKATADESVATSTAQPAASNTVDPNIPAIDETVPGGRYIDGDKVVNADGKVIEGLSVKDGKITGTAKGE